MDQDIKNLSNKTVNQVKKLQKEISSTLSGKTIKIKSEEYNGQLKHEETFPSLFNRVFTIREAFISYDNKCMLFIDDPNCKTPIPIDEVEFIDET